MTQHWRSEEPEHPTGAWLRARWKPNSLYVLNLDHYICSQDLRRGINIEWKHIDADDKTWRTTRALAMDRGWWAARFEYQTDTGRDSSGRVVSIRARFCTPDGTIVPPDGEPSLWLDGHKFDLWIEKYVINGWRDRVEEVRRFFEREEAA